MLLQFYNVDKYLQHLENDDKVKVENARSNKIRTELCYKLRCRKQAVKQEEINIYWKYLNTDDQDTVNETKNGDCSFCHLVALDR